MLVSPNLRAIRIQTRETLVGSAVASATPSAAVVAIVGMRFLIADERFLMHSIFGYCPSLPTTAL
jgi:hypothetical protein